jgi:amidohydrolase
MKLKNEQINELIAFRKELHRYPELANKEQETAKRIKAFVEPHKPDEIIECVGSHGILVVYKGEKPGENILLRADMDALPIAEVNDFEYKSVFHNVSHKCGHDGHSAIMAGVSLMLHKHRIKKGSVTLLFQPSEETGEGAELVLNDPKFSSLKIDHVFAFHNLPGFRKNSIVLRKQHFASASKGMTIKLTGKTSHAANPETGISPALAIAEIITQFSELTAANNDFKDFRLITIIHAKLGEIAFGTSPGYGEVMATLRSFRNDDMDVLTGKAIRIVEKLADKYSLHERIEWSEEFPASLNDDACVDVLEDIADENGFTIKKIEAPFRWSEDFGHFLMKYPGALFGIGSGKNHPALHNPDYDFPDEIIKTGVAMFDGIIRKFQD